MKRLFKTLTFLLLIEILIRSFFYSNLDSNDMINSLGLLKKDYPFPPNFNGVYDTHSIPYKVVTNELGFRNTETKSEMEKSYNILITGDSITFGQAVDQTFTYPYYLKTLFKNKTIINASKLGSSLPFQKYTFEKTISKIPIKEWYIHYFYNDVFNISEENDYYYGKKNFDLVNKLMGFAYTQSLLYTYAYFKQYISKQEHKVFQEDVSNSLTNPSFELVRKYLQEMNELAKSKSIPARLIIGPVVNKNIRNKYQSQREKVIEIAQNLNLKVIDGNEIFKNNSLDETLFNQAPADIIHLSKLGNKRFAEFVFSQ